MIDLKGYEVWFVTGSQHLYGQKTLEQVAKHSLRLQPRWEHRRMCRRKWSSSLCSLRLSLIRELCLEANSAETAWG